MAKCSNAEILFYSLRFVVFFAFGFAAFPFDAFFRVAGFLRAAFFGPCAFTIPSVFPSGSLNNANVTMFGISIGGITMEPPMPIAWFNVSSRSLTSI